MTSRRLLCVLAFAFCCAAGGAEPDERLIIMAPDGGGVEYDLLTGTATYTNGVVLKYGDTVLTGSIVQINERTADALAEGDVVILREGAQVWRGQRINYNFRTRIMSTPSFRAGQPPYFMTGEYLVTVPTNGSYVGTNGTVTTDDNPKPNYKIRAKRIVIVPGKSIEARHAIFYVQGVPVMYFPYYHKEEGRHPNNYEFLAGYRSSWGAFLLNTYNWYWNERLNGAVHFDLRSKRGLAGGTDFQWHDRAFGEGLLRYYYAHDIDPERVFGFRTPQEDRQRLLFQDQWRPRTNLTVKSSISYQSDPFVLRDFFESEYHDDVQPKSFVEANQAWRNWNLNGLAQFRVNDFQETVERLPDVKLTGLRQEIGPTPLYYESESSVGYFRHVFPVETNFYSPGLTNYFGATRADTYHQIILPWTFFGWLNVIPRVGQRLTYYGEANERGGTTDEEVRSVFNTGVEMTWKASRVYRGAKSELLDVNGLRHIIEPSINYAWVPDPEVRPHKLPQFDQELPSPRLLPIEFPDYNSIDSIDSHSVVRLGLRNRFQTKREDRVESLLNWAVYTDWRLSRHRGQTEFSDIYSDLDFKPRTWITFNSETRYGLHRGKFREANHRVTIQPNDTWSISLGHRYRTETPELGIGNSLISANFYYRLNENWGIRISEHFEARDSVLEYQYYTIYRDFRSWTGALTFRVRDSRFGANDYTVAFTLSLKAFPRYGVGDDTVRPSRLIGG
ncbi:MAG TPA: LPS assembly protein LptD [Methylomirabilota bacterium]|nr:LPS assembly protein LptD [Methylomirabilota bacterium]